MKLEHSQNRIMELMALFVLQIKSAASMRKTDLNKTAETILIPLFNEVYGWDLKNLNYSESDNYPGIDLADEVARICIQVTATTTLEKVKSTLDKFAKNNEYLKYDRLIIYILTERQNSYSEESIQKIIQKRFNFNSQKDVWDWRNILGDIANFQIGKVKKVQKILEDNFGEEFYQEAEQQRQINLARKLADQAGLLQHQQPHLLERSLLLAVEAVKKHHSLETDRVLRQGLSLLPLPLKTIEESGQLCARTVAFSPDGQYLAAGFDDIVQIWQWDENNLVFLRNLKHKAQVEPPEGSHHKEFHISENIFIDCKYLITISYEEFTKEGTCYTASSIWLWNLSDSQLVSVQLIPAIIDFHFDINQKTLITVSDTYNINVLNKIFVWKLVDGNWQVTDESFHKKHIWKLSISPNSRLLALAYDDKVICQTRDGKEYTRIQQKM